VIDRREQRHRGLVHGCEQRLGDDRRIADAPILDRLQHRSVLGRFDLDRERQHLRSRWREARTGAVTDAKIAHVTCTST
jgi:hypothetical protein